MQVLAVIFDILVSHRRMAKWHEERIAQHVQDAARLAEQREQMAQRLASHQQASTSSSKASWTPSKPPAPQTSSPAQSRACGRPAGIPPQELQVRWRPGLPGDGEWPCPGACQEP